ncbi:MAG: MFS transporter, partial [Flavobacteriales bacterium]
ASKDAIPMYWIAAPLTGLLVQPIIGYMSDRTWSSFLGRRRPYFLVGAILASIALFFVPHSPVVWIAVGCLWMLDASINISMEPFRALVADKLNESQRSLGFVVQALIIGIGTFVASGLPWFIAQMGVSNVAPDNMVPPNVKLAFAIGAAVFIITILVTVIFTKEYSPAEMEKFSPSIEKKKEKRGLIPPTLLRLGVVQFFSWFAFFTMWALAAPAITEHVFQAPEPIEELYDLKNVVEKAEFDAANLSYNNAADLVSRDMGFYGLSSMAFALILMFITYRMPINRKLVHMFSLFAGGAGFLLMYFVPDPDVLILSFCLIGIAWGSILSMPYAMLSSSIDPKKMGLFMGIFNMFIVIPQIIAAAGGLNFLYKNIFGEETIFAMVLAGCSLIIAGLANLLITDKNAISYSAAED